MSGHGYGHSTRVAEVLRAVRSLAPDGPLAVVTSGPESLYRRAVPGAFSFRPLECDVGLVQKGALVIDEEATAERWRAFAAGQEARVEREARWLREAGTRVVLGDIPPLAFEAASRAGVPSVALANFSWDWIYRHYSQRHPALGEAAAEAAASYRRAGLLLQLPFAGDLSAFPRRESVPLVARRPRLERDETRRRLGLPEGPVVLLSFGGLGLPGFDPAVLAALPRIRFVMDGREASGSPPNVRWIDVETLAGAGAGYIDLVGAADAVVTKPGYGIVSDAIGARTRLIYTERGDFPEYPIMVREMARWLPCRHVSNQDLLGGRLGAAIDDVLAMPFPEPPDLGGAFVAARRIMSIGLRA